MFTTQNPDPNARKPFLLLRPLIALWQWLFPPTVAHRDRQSTGARVLAAFTIVAFCVGIVAAAFMNGKQWYDSYQTWQSDRKISKAESFEKQERFVEAWIQANDAYALDPENPNVLRTLARYYTARKQKEALYLLDKLEKITTFTDEDRLLRIQALSNNDDDKEAHTKIEEVLRQSPPSARMVTIADHVMQRLGRREQLLGILRTYVERKPEDLEIKFMLATREVQFGTPSDAVEGMGILWTLAENPGKAGLEALQFLDQQSLATDAERKRLISLLQQHPLAGEEQKIAALRRLADLEPARKTEIMERAMQERKEAKREDLVPLARWLTQEGEHERLLGFLNLEMVQDFTPLLGQYLNALTMAGRLEDLEKLVKDPRTRLTTSERAFYKAHLAFVSKKKWEEINDLLTESLDAAKNAARPEQLIMIAQWAEQRGHPVVAEQAYRAAASSSGAQQIERMGHEGLLRLTYVNGNSKGFMDAARDTARRWPDNQHFLEQSLYASLLAGIEIESAIPRVQKMLESRPDDTQRKLLMALALYRMMDPKAALKQLNNINLGELKSMGKGAVLCGILHNGGGTPAAQAAQIAAQIPADAVMLPEERRFLQMVKGATAALSSNQPGQP